MFTALESLIMTICLKPLRLCCPLFKRVKTRYYKSIIHESDIGYNKLYKVHHVYSVKITTIAPSADKKNENEMTANEGDVKCSNSEYSKHWCITSSLLFSAKYKANCSVASVLSYLFLPFSKV